MPPGSARSDSTTPPAATTGSARAQPCFVCRVKTENTCSRCFQAGANNFFCSPACHRLVWPVHRLVCGPRKAKPFQWSLLTQAEAHEAVKHLHSSMGKPASTDWQRTTVAKVMRQCAGILPEQAAHAISAVTVGIGDPLRPRTMTPPGIINDLAKHDLNIARDEPFWSPGRDEPWRKDNYMRAAEFTGTTVAASKPELAAHLLEQFRPVVTLAAEQRAKAAALGMAV
ncbi:hypothetical protein DMC30DRAFT_446511 [Rhodotorula diobovata]|uniref:MYND-type domain-containing protein n=1 Tax=Rhodotorula diobovata TaxID=5288 RepID=A0A5C5FVP4_9BASI|nr:hypothetical protein DMC30DRAFT_446511 [Rhodotorula diobovata]